MFGGFSWFFIVFRLKRKKVSLFHFFAHFLILMPPSTDRFLPSLDLSGAYFCKLFALSSARLSSFIFSFVILCQLLFFSLPFPFPCPFPFPFSERRACARCMPVAAVPSSSPGRRASRAKRGERGGCVPWPSKVLDPFRWPEHCGMQSRAPSQPLLRCHERCGTLRDATGPTGRWNTGK